MQEALRSVRADGAVVTEPTELELVVAHRGFVWGEVEVDRPRGSRLAAPSRSRRHREDGRGPLRARAIWTVAREPHPPAAGPRLRPRLAHHRRHRAVQLPGELHARPGAPHPARRDRRSRSTASSRRFSTAAERRTPTFEATHRTTLVREPFEIDEDGGARDARLRRRRGGPPRAAQDRRRELLGRLGVHRRRRDPHGRCSAPAGRARTPPRSGSASRTPRRSPAPCSASPHVSAAESARQAEMLSARSSRSGKATRARV